MIQTGKLVFYLAFLFFNSLLHPSSCQSNSPKNIETFYPYTYRPSPADPPASPPPISPTLTPSEPPISPPQPPRGDPPSKKAIFTAVGVTAASTFVLAAAFLFLCGKYMRARQMNGNKGAGATASARPTKRLTTLPPSEFARFDGNIKGLIVDENGLDVLYWKKLDGIQKKSSYRREGSDQQNNGKATFSRGRSSTSYNQVHPEANYQTNIAMPASSMGMSFQAVGKPESGQTLKTSLDSTPAAPLPPSASPVLAIQREKSHSKMPPPPSLPPTTSPPPPPPPPPIPKKNPTPPPPPSIPKKNPTPPPPPPPRPDGSAAPKPPSATRQTNGNKTGDSISGEGTSGSGNDKVKLKPLHWEKVNIDTDHSMVWGEIERGSFKYNADMMEALFGYVATNRKSPKEGNSVGKNEGGSNHSAMVFILEARRSQNIAIVLRSLGIPRETIVDALLEGKSLSSDTLEKLSRVSPTKEEEFEILAYDGDPAELAAAESFLYHLLKAVPSAFTRVNAMLFKLNYYYEIPHLKNSLQTLESACNELRSRGVFLKLLEAILKAGNRLNAGTSRGDAKAFNLTTLLKLSDYKSSDRNTTLLHFVVHEVVRNEGRRCVMTRNNSWSLSSNTNSSTKAEDSTSKEEREREFIKLGLPVVGGLSAQFSDVKVAASIDKDSLTSSITSLTAKVDEFRQLVVQCGTNGGGGFFKVMKDFLKAADEELRTLNEEQTRVMDFVKRTNQYYHSGDSKDKQPLHIFAIVKDFLGMVDQACTDIARSLLQRKPRTADAVGSSSSLQQDALRTRVTFPRLPEHFLSDKSSSSDSEDEF
ncbi:hypothetical protein Ancab_020608 [Ancistrocladus abbreviatus]